MNSGDARWIALVWRLPTGSSTPRVSIWRTLKRLGAATLTPGAALLPFHEDLLEQLGWLAQEIEDMGGTGWVLPVTELSDTEASRIRTQVNQERGLEYEAFRVETGRVSTRLAQGAGSYREVEALRQRFERIRARDHFGAPGRAAAERTLGECVAKGSTGARVERHALRH
jgi:hypothetical protein